MDLPPATDDGRQWDGTNQDATRHTHESKRPSGEKHVGNIEVATVADVFGHGMLAADVFGFGLLKSPIIGKEPMDASHAYILREKNPPS